MICPLCNTLNRDDAKFCKKCGRQLIVEVKVPETAAADQVSAPEDGTTSIDDDASLAPTQILTPQQMLAMQTRRWQKEMEREQQYRTQTTTAGDEVPTPTSTAMGSAEIFTRQSASSPGPNESEQAQDIADMPTLVTQPVSDDSTMPISASTAIASDEVVPIPPPPPPIAVDTPPAEVTQEEEKVPNENTASPEPKEEVGDEIQSAADQAGQPDQPEQTGEPVSISTVDFPVLVVGTIVFGRYEVTEVRRDETSEHVYQVTDHQGYQHCWNCGSEQNSAGDEFCNDCGAELSNFAYNMHEYPETRSNNTDAGVIQGAIVNTFVEQGRTYMIEQPQVAENVFPTGVHLLAACDSDAGNVRRSEPNEDCTLVIQLERVHESTAVPVGVFIVADGLGGHDNGQVASRMTIGTIAERMVRELLAAPLAAEKAGEATDIFEEEKLVSLLQGTVEDANTVLCEVNQRDKTDMGSTITGFMVVGEHAYILNVGDSRTYMMRGRQIYQLTNDHSLVGQLVASGLIQPDDVYTHPQRSQIFRSLGDKLNVQVDTFKQQLHPGDMLLSCSDGLWEMVRNPQIETILKNAPNPQVACTQLLEAANTNGGEDNISAVVVFVY